MSQSKKNILFFLIFLFAITLYPNRPHVVNLYREKYRADNKNWSIGQDERGVIYFGNDIGLLEFDGIEWKLTQKPNTPVIRSLAVLSHQTIFTGMYEEFGRWDRGISGQLHYTSLSAGIDKKLLKNDDFWRIWIADNLVYFQSFGSIYVYDYKTVKQITRPQGFLLLSKVRNEFLVQEMQGAIYRLSGYNLEKIEGSEIFSNTDVRVILPYGKDQYLIGTTTKGLYIYDGNKFTEWNQSLSAVLNAKDLNCGILSSRGTYFLGTILDGIYEVDKSGEIINHISSQNYLQNNTILSLYEDHTKNIWVALDRGISYIQYVDNMSYYTDPNGNAGVVYGAVLWNNKLFVGTNQGVFYLPQEGLRKSSAMADLKLINGTQGQVWSFSIVDDKLYCCHNKGLKEIHPDLSVSNPYDLGVGVYSLAKAKIREQDLLLLATYNSLKIVNRKTDEISTIKEIQEPIINAEVDHLDNLWLEHANRGVYKCKLADDMKSFRSFLYYGGNSNDSLPYKLTMFKVGGRIVLLGGNKFYTYDDIADKIVPNASLNKTFETIKNIKRVVHIQDNLFWALSNSSVYKFSYDGYNANILESYNVGINNLSLVNAYENISVLSDSSSLICLDNGFLLYNNASNGNNKAKNTLYAPNIGSFQIRNINSGEVDYRKLSEPAEVPYNFNTVTIYFSVNDAFSSNRYFQYMLQDVDREWSAPQKINKASYARLPKGKYVFLIRTVDDMGNYSETVSYHFEVLPPWYQTFWAYIFYIVLIVFTLYMVWMIILRRYRNLHLQKIRNRETKRLRALTGQLQQEIEVKNAELLTQTSFIIQKNELILKLKDIVDNFYSTNKSNALAPLYQKINVLLNNNMDTEDDWKMFLIKFEQKHTGFFKKLKSLYPQLTNSDLRLCACLKLNLETKDVASLMNLSVRAVENSRYRLRKKLNLQPSQNLNDFFRDID